jgi:hypothetical protein
MEARMSSNAVALVFLGLLAAACTSSQSTSPTLTQGEAPRGCPLGVPGATVTAEDTADGIALTFTSSKDRVDEMRARARESAAQHGPGERLGLGHDGRHGHGGEHGLQTFQAPPSRSVAEDTENGARIRFVPADPADTDALRAKLRERADAMNAASCK